MKFKATAVFLVTFLIFQTPVFGQILNPKGGIDAVSDGDIWAQTLSGSHYNEMWNYQFYLDDGITVHIAFSVANFGSFKSPVSGVQMSIYNFDGELYQVSREYAIHYLIQDKEQHMFQLRDERTIYFRGELPKEHEVRVAFTKNDITYDVDLKLSNIHKGLKWGDGMFQIGDEKLGIITHIPYADVKGIISINDKVKQVKGQAYMDHTFQNRATTDLVHSGYRFVHQDNKENWDLTYFFLPEHTNENKTVGYRVVNEDGKLSINGVEYIDRLTTGEALDVDIARILDLRMEDSGKIRISRTKDYEKFSILSELGWLAKKAAKSFLGGEILYLRGEAVLMEQGNRPKKGHYNFFIID